MTLAEKAIACGHEGAVKSCGHGVKVWGSRGQAYDARCSCGWYSGFQEPRRQALATLNAHYRAVLLNPNEE